MELESKKNQMVNIEVVKATSSNIRCKTVEVICAYQGKKVHRNSNKAICNSETSSKKDKNQKAEKQDYV